MAEQGFVFSESATKRIVQAVRQIEREPVRGSGQSFRKLGDVPFTLLRGTADTDVLDTDDSFEIENIKALGESSPVPVDSATDKLRIANPGALTFSAGDLVYCVYCEQDVDDPLGGTEPVTVFWEAIKTGAGGSGTTIKRILVGGVPALTIEVDGDDITLTPGSANGWLIDDLVSPSGSDPLKYTLNIGFGTDSATVVEVLNFMTYPLENDAGYTVVFGKPVTYVNELEQTVTAYEIIPFDFTGGQNISGSDTNPEAVYHEAGTRGLLWGYGGCG